MQDDDYADVYIYGPAIVQPLARGPAMSELEHLMTQLDDSLQQLNCDDIFAVIATVPWAREALHTYLISHRTDVEQDVLVRIEELMARAA